MKRFVSSSLLLLFMATTVSAQLILPKFEQRTKLERLSDDAEESNIFTYNEGNNIFFYRSYIQGEGNEMEVIRQNIWFSEKENEKWAKPDRLFRMKENEVENIIIGSSLDGKKVYIFKTSYYPSLDSLERKIGSLSQNEKGEWGEFEEINIPDLVLGENYYHFHLSHDEKILMISMSPSNEQKNEDLFVSFKGDDGGWSKVKNLGPILNTNRVEISPFIANDNRTLYFSSEGHGGFGGSDVFVTYRLDDSWTNWMEPMNLGESINSKDYEENFVATVNNEYYFTSNKDSESADIFYSYSDFAVELNEGKAISMKQNMPMPIMLSVMDKEGNTFDKVTSKNDGSFQFKIKENVDQLSFKTEEVTAEGAFIYLLDKDGNKRERWTIGSDLQSHAADETVNTQKIVGGLQMNGSALANTEVEVYDINNYKIAKVMTDDKGIFSLETSEIDNTLQFNPLTDGAYQFNSIQLYDVDGKFQSHLEHENGKVDKGKKVSEEQLAKNVQPAQTATPASTEGKAVVPATKPVSSSAPFTDVYYFEFNAISLDSSETRKLRSVINYMKANSNAKISVIGHTDSEGESELNQSIGMKRAYYVRRALVNEGIDINRISVESKGKSSPKASNDSEEGRAQNRRAEIMLQ